MNTSARVWSSQFMFINWQMALVYTTCISTSRPRGSGDGSGTMLQVWRLRVLFSMSLDLILLPSLWSWCRLSLKQKWGPGVFVVLRGCLENVAASTSHNPNVLHSLLQWKLCLFFLCQLQYIQAANSFLELLYLVLKVKSTVCVRSIAVSFRITKDFLKTR